jgi:hypothetical protein
VTEAEVVDKFATFKDTNDAVVDHKSVCDELIEFMILKEADVTDKHKRDVDGEYKE